VAYFPAFIKLDDLDILIVGGGNIALEKLEHLLDFAKSIKIIAPYISKSMQKVIDDNNLIFPSYIKKDDLTIAVSTSGSSPAVAKYLKSFLQDIIPNNIGEFLKQMKDYRKTMPKNKQRMEFLDKKAKEYIDTFRSSK